MVTLAAVPETMLDGETLLTVGAGVTAAVTVKVAVALPATVVTVRVLAPVAAAAVTVTGAVICVALTVVPPKVTPVPLTESVPPVRFVPTRVTVCAVVP